ncbi:MAG: ABC transporter ATP-binding protein [Christensenella sp.]|uniref:ABC transporter ATP-binding protein n=1 Tax=Christensenella sp. TaxID=1935934 RepID=UPI002B1F6302|nr:ABC transporter ATP-binding protein [Christensenella sp.]MEA5003476.1 ABC transporter ATP-binding protein [Christensenella sp.]
MEDYAIRIKGLTKDFGYKSGGFLLDSIDLDVKKNQFVTILGPSGCGKSVLLNLMIGIERPTAGSIEYNGAVFENGIPKDYRKQLGFVFQDSNLLAWRTVKKNLLFPIEIFKMQKEIDGTKRADELLELIGMQKSGNSYPHELSGGMKQRVNFVRGLMHDPDVLLLDQPFGALDAITRKMLNYDLLNLWKHTHKTIVMVTNNVEEAILLSSRVVFMSKTPGRIKEIVDIDIPDEARGVEIAQYPGYADIVNKLETLVRTLDIKTSERDMLV